MNSIPIYRTIAEIRGAVATEKAAGKRVGLVPTMGALHDGHGRLIETAKRESGFVVVSIFVNPTQFGPNEDFARYPRTFDADRTLCAAAGADAIFAPDAATIYPPGFCTFVEVHGLQDKLCGASRPGHFRGVCTVVLKLFHIVEPNVAFFGQKDAQQSLILTRMVRDLDVGVEIKIVPTVREPDGLAMSSRNRYLDPEQRFHATALWRALKNAKQRIDSGERDPDVLEKMLMSELEQTPGARLDYASVVSADTLEKPAALSGRVLVAVAVFFGTTRLIDNVQVELL
jgi:pantoate--beta-alanine ligase